MRFLALILVGTSAFAAGNATKGKELFRTCSGCHNTANDQKKTGPSLRSLFGKVTLRNGKRADDGNVREIVRDGFNGMPSFGYSFRPAEMDQGAHGAGGVPVRTEADLETIHAHTRLGNYPMMRCYSGTRDTMRWAPMLARTINNAWCAIPLFWYTQLDGRSPRPLREAIPEPHSSVDYVEVAA